MVANALNWFELPGKDMGRARRFYGTLLDLELPAQETMPGLTMTTLSTEDGVGGALVNGEGYFPSHDGSLVYLNGDDQKVIQDRVEAAGGKVLAAKTGIGENGFTACFDDGEGNKVGLPSVSSFPFRDLSPTAPLSQQVAVQARAPNEGSL